MIGTIEMTRVSGGKGEAARYEMTKQAKLSRKLPNRLKLYLFLLIILCATVYMAATAQAQELFSPNPTPGATGFITGRWSLRDTRAACGFRVPGPHGGTAVSALGHARNLDNPGRQLSDERSDLWEEHRSGAFSIGDGNPESPQRLFRLRRSAVYKFLPFLCAGRLPIGGIELGGGAISDQ